MAQTPEQKRIIKRWVKNLESGQYAQTGGRLCLTAGNKGENGKKVKYDSFCCLGVLCDMAVRAKVIEPPVVDGNGSLDYNGESSLLPRSVRQWAGLRSEAGQYHDAEKNSGHGNLANVNDSGASFKKIAKIIRSAPKGLFV